MLNTAEKTKLISLARSIRKNLIAAIHNAQTGHPGTSLSMIEILTLLYFKIMRYDCRRPHDPDRDYFILSKGHGSPALYATLMEAGFLQKEELLQNLRKFGGRLQGHPNAACLPGVDVSTGSLGQGISIAIGVALGLKLNKKTNKVYCMLGDGELQEGQVWEAGMAAAFFKLDNLVVVVDRNFLQSDGRTDTIMDLGDISAKWKSFGWTVYSDVKGHDFTSLYKAFRKASHAATKPSVIIAHTVKGKGISFMENTVHWHHHPINKEEFELAMNELNR